MTPEVQAHVFEPFFTTKGIGKGTGLGLASVYGIVKQHGGYIAIESAPGAGTAVSIYLARVAAPGDGVESAGRDAAPVVGSGTGARRRGRGGSSCRRALPARPSRWSRVTPARIDLLLTDVVIPEMSGRDLADRLTAARPVMKVFYMSGYTDDAIVHHGVLDPGTALLTKPFTPDALPRRVGDLLSG
jgi:two-component system, cell cycle sensor histidine kinase and response regulator CckA